MKVKVVRQISYLGKTKKEGSVIDLPSDIAEKAIKSGKVKKVESKNTDSK